MATCQLLGAWFGRFDVVVPSLHIVVAITSTPTTQTTDKAALKTFVEDSRNGLPPNEPRSIAGG
jgi:hypothetical protein